MSENPEAPPPVEKSYSIGDVSRLLQVKPHVIRYWEEAVPFVAPKKSVSGRRLYTDRELQLLLRLKHLLYDKRYTIEGARERIWNEVEPARADLRARIAAVRSELLGIWVRLHERRRSEGWEERQNGEPPPGG
jgi:DNA-binding transcriptional MerR regulator